LNPLRCIGATSRKPPAEPARCEDPNDDPPDPAEGAEPKLDPPPLLALDDALPPLKPPLDEAPALPPPPPALAPPPPPRSPPPPPPPAEPRSPCAQAEPAASDKPATTIAARNVKAFISASARFLAVRNDDCATKRPRKIL
jgi:hypothetical protein